MNESLSCEKKGCRDSVVQYVVLKVCKMPLMARWLSWLERRPVTAEVDGSNPFRVVFTNENNNKQWENR